MADNWKADILSLKKYRIDSKGIVRGVVSQSDDYLFHKQFTKGAHLRKLKENKFHQIYWETPYYIKIFSEYISSIDLSRKIFMDLGCGDGRFTQFLLDRGAQRIICVDFDYHTLLSLSEYLDSNDVRDRVILFHSDFHNLDLPKQSLDTILAIGVLYYLNDDYEFALKKLNSCLKPNGQLILSDPDLEGSILRMLIYNSLEDAIHTFENRKFKETKNQSKYEFRVFDRSEWAEIFAKTGYKVSGMRGISLFHNLLRVLQLKGIIKKNELIKYEPEIWKMLDYLHDNGSLSKHIIWNLFKRTK